MDNKDARDIIAWAIEHIGRDKMALASSLSIEDQAVTWLLQEQVRQPRVFSLDTGRLFPETYDVIDRTNKTYDLQFEILFPEADAVREMVEAKGINLFYDSVENRKQCCGIRKVQPLNKMLSTLDAWITGLRRDQAVTRTHLHKIQWDEDHHMVKINPIADWSYEQVWQFVREHNIPYNPLQDRHFPSIGCAPCTRPIQEGEDLRAGRWWWESPEHKECGLHVSSEQPPSIQIGKMKI